MRFCPIPDANFYTEIRPLWSYYCCEPNKKWKNGTYQPPHHIRYWRELEVIKRDKEKRKEQEKLEREKEIEEEKIRKKNEEKMKKKMMKVKRKRKQKKRKKPIVEEEVPFEIWQKTRIRCEACLPIYYTTGNRFIRLERDQPAGFKCLPLPVNLAEAREIRAQIRAARAQRRAAAKAERQRKIDERRKALDTAWKKFSALALLVL